jgi:hypothetical protein
MSTSIRQWARVRCLLVAGAAALAVGLSAGPAAAQVLYGNVTGIVTDPQGYRVPGASIVITNTANGLQRETVTNTQGEYNIVNVQPGSYDVRISMGTNFKAFERRGVNIRQGDIASYITSCNVFHLAGTCLIPYLRPWKLKHTASPGQSDIVA